jgi:hypothetical protein
MAKKEKWQKIIWLILAIMVIASMVIWTIGPTF